MAEETPPCRVVSDALTDRVTCPIVGETVSKAVAIRKAQRAKIWQMRDTDCLDTRISAELKPVLEEVAKTLLKKLHPNGEVFST